MTLPADLVLLADTQDAGADWTTAIVSGLVVAIVQIVFQFFHERRLSALESKLNSKSGFFIRRIEKHEALWPLIAECNRQQTALAAQKRQGADLKASAQQIAEARKKLKNFVYDNGLYFDESIRKLTQDLDSQLADPSVLDVRVAVESLERRLRDVLKELD